MRSVVRLAMVCAWLAWLSVAWVMFVSFGFGQAHEILIITAVFVALPVLLLVLRRFAWRPVRLRTLLWVGGAGCVWYAMVAVAVANDWIGVATTF